VAAAVVVAAAAEAAGVSRRALLIAPRQSYRVASYLDAARSIGIDLLIASDGQSSLADSPSSGIRVPFNAQDAVARICAYARAEGVSAIVATDDASTEMAASVGVELGLPHNSPHSARLAHRKDLARQRLKTAGLPTPIFWIIDLERHIPGQISGIEYPCVVKPVSLSGSRGVIRADNPADLLEAITRIQSILAREGPDTESRIVLVEEFLAGDEVAVEGILTDGKLDVLAIFDKPDPLNGPFFEETLYITPSRHDTESQRAVCDSVSDACAAYGLISGPVHAECRINSRGVWIIEVAARTIGGLCGRLLRFGAGLGLEELVLRHSLGEKVVVKQEHGGAGVMMIPIPGQGILRRVEGLEAARGVPYVEDVVIDVREGYELVPLPDGASYLGFIYARAPTATEAESALRAAHAQLNIVVAPLWKVDRG